ncbi:MULTISPECIES: hypothetical protein [Enterobacterales]|uniref:hypothetical protein n=1 Tax=Enterobacterales TaxID=91347 RepID=UPI0012EA3A6C|nr:hypothetical protein [Klebsiella pneumoniae]
MAISRCVGVEPLRSLPGQGSRWEKILLENYGLILLYVLIGGRLATLQTHFYGRLATLQTHFYGRLATLQSSRGMSFDPSNVEIWQVRTDAKSKRRRVGGVSAGNAETNARCAVPPLTDLFSK